MALCLLSLVLFGCGKSNQTNSNGNSNPSSSIPSSSSPVLAGGVGSSDQQWNEFKAGVVAGSFAAKVATTEIYHYTGYTVAVTSSTCLGIFTCTSSKTTNSYFDREYSDSIIRHPFCSSSGACTTENIRQRIVQIVGQAFNYGRISQNRYEIYTYTGYTYLIDLNFPIVANPLARLDNNGSFYNFTQPTTRF